jgi:hypothetical protein
MAAWIGWNSSESDSWALEIKHDWTAILWLRNRERYPAPIVNIEETRRYASDIVWSFRKRQVKGRERILKSMFLIESENKKNKILMTIFLKNKLGKHHNG